MRILIFFLALCFAQTSFAKRACVNLFEPSVLKNIRFPVSGLMHTGVAEFTFSDATTETLIRESVFIESVPHGKDDWDMPKYDAVRESYQRTHTVVAADILSQLTSALPQFRWSFYGGNGRGNGQGIMPAGARTAMRHFEKYLPEWHRDATGTDQEVSEKAFLENKLDRFILRVTVALPYGKVPSTWVKPVRGEHELKPVEAAKGSAVGFMRYFGWHTTPEFDQDFRAVYILDFQAEPMSFSKN